MSCPERVLPPPRNIGPFARGLVVAGLLLAPVRLGLAQESGPSGSFSANPHTLPAQGAPKAAREIFHEDLGLKRLVQRALAAFRIRPERTRTLMMRARRSAWLPSLQLRFRRGRGRDLRSAALSNEGERWSSDDDLAVEASATFYLSRALYHDDEVALLREERARWEEEQKLVRYVISLYFERQRLLADRDPESDRQALRIRIREIEALLHSIAGDSALAAGKGSKR